MNFSAADLVKKSASQLLYKELKKLSWVTTPRQLQGNTYAEEIVKKEEASEEKRGIINIGEDLLFFCIDMIKDNKCIEIKMVDDEDNYEEWYLNSSIMQSTFYASLLQKVKTLDTPKFRKKEGFLQEIIQVPANFIFELWFGSKKFEILPNTSVLDHYLNKATVIKEGVETRNFDNCRLFDLKYKFKEFDIFKPDFKTIIINH